jgi:hypothetical protein
MLSLKNLHHKISDVFIKENIVICSENVNEIQCLGFFFVFFMIITLVDIDTQRLSYFFGDSPISFHSLQLQLAHFDLSIASSSQKQIDFPLS